MKNLLPLVYLLVICMYSIPQISFAQNIEDCDGALEERPLKRDGALFGLTDFPINGNEIYTWHDATTDKIVAKFTGNPYYSPSNISSYYVVVTDPDYPDCYQVIGPRIINSLDGCCELNGGDSDTEIISGCTNPEACNYDPEAIIDDNSCLLPNEDEFYCIKPFPAPATEVCFDFCDDGISLNSGNVYPNFFDAIIEITAPNCFTYRSLPGFVGITEIVAIEACTPDSVICEIINVVFEVREECN